MFKKKNKVSSLVVVLSLMLAISGCGDDTSSSNSVFNQMFEKTGTIQGKIFDANDGTAIGGADLKITLIQGTQHRSPSLLITDETQSLVGEYAFDGVPVELDNGNITYKMRVEKTGYQTFEGNVTLSDNTVGAGRLPNTTDTFFNRIANIYLFPLGQNTPDVDVVVESNRGPVLGAQVRLVQNATANVAAGEIGNRLVPSPGLLPTLTATTVADANDQAVATFSGAGLALGGAYTPTVVPLKQGNIQLVSPVIPQIIVGAPGAVTPIVVAMNDLEPGGQAFGLHVESASNRRLGIFTGLTVPGRGVLRLQFNRAVAIVDDVVGGTPFTASLVNAGGAILTGTGTAASVTAALSPNGLILTLTPVFTNDPVAGDTGLDVVFAGGLLVVLGEEGAGGNDVFAGPGLSFQDGTTISGTVHITSP